MDARSDPHRDQPVARSGAPPGSAGAAIVLVHGRGGSAAGMLPFGREVLRRAGADGRVALLAPQAADQEWYAKSFLAPVEQNEPALSSALAVLDRLVGELDGKGLPADRTVLLGFSQGACLVSEYAARNPRRYGGVVVLAGGLIGDEVDDSRYSGSLDGSPVLLACGDHDSWVPLERFDETARVLETLEGDVDRRVYPGMGHTVNDDELDAAAAILRAVLDGATPA